MYNNHETQEKNQCLNISDLDFYSEVYELTDDDLNNINGGAAAAIAVGGLVEIIDHKWGSGASGGKHRRGGKHRAPSNVSWGKIAAKLAVRGVGGAAGFALGGPIGAGLAGED